jgi:hypothetical protein
MFFKSKRGQNTAEYAILFGVIVATAIGIQTFVKRGLNGRAKTAVDYMGREIDTALSMTGSGTGKFEDTDFDSEIIRNREAKSNAKLSEDGSYDTAIQSMSRAGELSTQYGTQIYEYEEE